MNTLFNTNLENLEPEVKLSALTYHLQEGPVRLERTIVNTVGFGHRRDKQQRCVCACVCACVCGDDDDGGEHQFFLAETLKGSYFTTGRFRIPPL